MEKQGIQSPPFSKGGIKIASNKAQNLFFNSMLD